jgi:hypothetical protein
MTEKYRKIAVNYLLFDVIALNLKEKNMTKIRIDEKVDKNVTFEFNFEFQMEQKLKVI